MKHSFISCLIVATTIALTGCAANHNPDEAITICTERSPVCTQDYTPVCGKHENKSWRTFANACTACSDITTVGYKTGECP